MVGSAPPRRRAVSRSADFAEPYPARTAIGVAALPLGAAVEMDVVVG